MAHDLKELSTKALKIRQLYDTLNQQKRGLTWTRLNLMEGFVGDVGDLMKIIMAKEGIRAMENVDEKLAHELADCLWSVLVLAEKYEIDLEASFLKTMDELDARIQKELV